MPQYLDMGNGDYMMPTLPNVTVPNQYIGVPQTEYARVPYHDVFVSFPYTRTPVYANNDNLVRDENGNVIRGDVLKYVDSDYDQRYAEYMRDHPWRDPSENMLNDLLFTTLTGVGAARHLVSSPLTSAATSTASRVTPQVTAHSVELFPSFGGRMAAMTTGDLTPAMMTTAGQTVAMPAARSVAPTIVNGVAQYAFPATVTGASALAAYNLYNKLATSGNEATETQTGPKVGDTRVKGGKTFVFDGKYWQEQPAAAPAPEPTPENNNEEEQNNQEQEENQQQEQQGNQEPASPEQEPAPQSQGRGLIGRFKRWIGRDKQPTQSSGQATSGQTSEQTANGQTPPNANGFHIPKWVWETKYNNYGEKYWKLRNIGRIGLVGSTWPGRKAISWAADKIWVEPSDESNNTNQSDVSQQGNTYQGADTTTVNSQPIDYGQEQYLHSKDSILKVDKDTTVVE